MILGLVGEKIILRVSIFSFNLTEVSLRDYDNPARSLEDLWS